MGSSYLFAYILTAIYSLMPGPSPKWNETQEHYDARMEIIAHGIATSVEKKVKAPHRLQMAIAEVVTFWGETRFNPELHSGARLGDGGHAICLGQHHQLWRTESEWRGLAGQDLEATTRCAEETALGLKRAWHYCNQLDPKFGYAQAFVLYGTGKTCRANESRYREVFEQRERKWKALIARKAPEKLFLSGKPPTPES